jgi:hypothetical protein
MCFQIVLSFYDIKLDFNEDILVYFLRLCNMLRLGRKLMILAVHKYN